VALLYGMFGVRTLNVGRARLARPTQHVREEGALMQLHRFHLDVLEEGRERGVGQNALVQVLHGGEDRGLAADSFVQARRTQLRIFLSNAA
jgi:hypothetical protein